MQNILVAHDGSKSSDKALKKALEISSSFNVPITIVAVVPDLYLTELSPADRKHVNQSLASETQEFLERIRRTLAGKSIEVKMLIREGDPAEKILETAQKMKATLIIVGSHGRHGAKKFLLGSVSSKIVDHAGCSVLVAK